MGVRIDYNSVAMGLIAGMVAMFTLKLMGVLGTDSTRARVRRQRRLSMMRARRAGLV